jgi:hypothetical protein
LISHISTPLNFILLLLLFLKKMFKMPLFLSENSKIIIKKKLKILVTHGKVKGESKDFFFFTLFLNGSF